MNSLKFHLPVLQSMALFRGVGETELETMLGCLGGYLREFKKDEFLIMQEENVRIVGVILQGNVQMIREDLWGNQTILVTMGEGELFGETFACGTQKKSTVSFLSSGNTLVLFLPFERVMYTCTMLCTFHHRIIENMVTLIAEKNQTLMDKVDILSRKSLREKIATYLIQQSAKQNTTYFEIPLGRVQLAEFLGADRSALTRELNHMRDEGWIDFHKNSFHILKDLEDM